MHTRTSTNGCGPDYCAECSASIQAWVKWPCDTADITARRHGGNELSTAAAASIDKAAIRAKVLAVIASLDFGATSDEVEAITGLSHQTVSARMSELKRDGAVVPAGRRPTRSGRTAAVWVAAPAQGELFGSGAA